MPDFFKYCPNCKSEKISKDNEKKFICDDCGFIYFHNVASACAVILKYKGKILFTRRKFDPARNTLDLPGGFVDYNEDVQEALKREVYEELNLKINNVRFLSSFPNKYKYKNIIYNTLDLIFIAHIDSIENIQVNDDVSGYELIKPEEVDIDKIGLISIKNAIQYYTKSFI